jgi:hypothetical protein
MLARSTARIETMSWPFTSHASARLLTVLPAVLTVVVLSGCGSSKPTYCSDRTTLESSVKALPGMASKGDLSGLRSQVSKIQGEANKVADSAKSDFPTETSALQRDVNTLVNSVNDLPSNPSTSDYAKVGLNAATAISAVSNFSSATNSKCS